MKIIITESQKNNIIEKILDSEGVTYKMNYGGRIYVGEGAMYDSVDLWFKLPNGDDTLQTFYFLTRRNKILKLESYNDLTKLIDVFRYIPSEIVKDYFKEKCKTYLENTLPQMYRY
jgi:hypothetical protein